MQPSDKQKKIALFVEQQGRFWQRTNDINSPTHYSDIDESLRTLEFDEIITEKEAAILEAKMCDLFVFIKNIK